MKIVGRLSCSVKMESCQSFYKVMPQETFINVVYIVRVAQLIGNLSNTFLS